MKVPSLDQLEEAVFTNPANPRAVSNFFGALLDAGADAGLAGQAASALGRVYASGLKFIRDLVADRGANALLYDEAFRDELREQIVELERLSRDVPTLATRLMDRLEQRSAEPEDRGRVRAWVGTLRQLAAQFSVESILDLPDGDTPTGMPQGGLLSSAAGSLAGGSAGGLTGAEGSGDITPFGAGAVARVFRSLVVLGGLVEMLGEEDLPAGVAAGALAEAFREIGTRLRPSILGDGRGWQGLVEYLNDFSSGDQLPRS